MGASKCCHVWSAPLFMSSYAVAKTLVVWELLRQSEQDRHLRCVMQVWFSAKTVLMSLCDSDEYIQPKAGEIQEGFHLNIHHLNGQVNQEWIYLPLDTWRGSKIGLQWPGTIRDLYYHLPLPAQCSSREHTIQV